MGNVSISIAALCQAKNLPELETWSRDIIIVLEWEQGKPDKYAGISRIGKKCINNGGSSLITSKSVRDKSL